MKLGYVGILILTLILACGYSRTITISSRLELTSLDVHRESIERIRSIGSILKIVSDYVELVPDQTRAVTVNFSEPMDTSSVSITAGNPPDFCNLIVVSHEWSCTHNPEPYFDTWIGTVMAPSTGFRGYITLRIVGQDPDGNVLKHLVRRSL